MDAHRGEPRLSALPAPDTAGSVLAAFDPARLTLARERSGLTKRDLASRTDVTAVAITRFEKDEAVPSAGTLARLARELGVPVAYFTAGRPVLPVPETAAHFRSLRTTRAGDRRQARATMSHLAETVRAIQTVVRLPELRLPHHGTEPETAARSLRAYWGLPTGPVHHLVRLLEANGAVVSMARFGAGERIDAFSCRPAGLDRPLICLSRDRGNPLRRRFSAAHELGHLLLHDEASPGDRAHEQEANRFAAEFLTPSAEIALLLPTRLDLARLLEIQRTWGVSVQALLRRSRELDRIDDDLYRKGMATLTRLGWRRDEPTGEYPTEWPAVLAEAVALGASRGLTETSLATRLCLPVAEVRELLSHVTGDRPRLSLVPPN